MGAITTKQLNFWTDGSKFKLDTVDDGKVQELLDFLKLSLAPIYDTSSWTIESMPSVIKSIISVRYVGHRYIAVTTDVAEDNTYGQYLLSLADSMEQKLFSSRLPLEGTPTAISNSADVKFVESEPLFTMDMDW